MEERVTAQLAEREPHQRILMILTYIIYTNQDPIESLEDVLVYAMEPPTKKHKRESEDVKSKKNKFVEFVEEKLIQHTQALEHLIKTATNNGVLIKTLIENLSHKMEEPKMPEKIEVHRQSRRSNSEDTDNPLIKFGRSIPTYGVLFKDMIMRAFERDDAPTPLVERRSNDFEYRRSYGGSPIILPENQINRPSPWCAVAVVCRRTFNPICGYDDNFGYGKFDDLCHMLQVNCYWKYNFALVPTCRPGLNN
ncbi:uncharacterized protein LOC119829149 [Zerene cesonia]|uniref:uncharacterized protein LOC119829149 n=1 Tax=Zerene cesonia TaxID=33412 RepID=UPI0018E57B99|nr:uncharacterized protein LOC119829149 [Zerene cesonia]